MTAADEQLAALDTAAAATYATAHRVYRAAGWRGPLPLPRGAKWPPPDGFTGWHGIDPSGADSQTWVDDYPEYRDTPQLALRMPDDVVGIDVDHYGDKRGADTLTEAERRWGALPPAPMTTARGAGPSGIRLYRVPAGTALRTRIAFGELNLGDIEIVQRHHRYAVAWPSIHPATGEPYLWRDSVDGSPIPGVPNTAHLYDLPETWVEALRGAGDPGEAAADPETVRAFHVDHSTGDRTAAPGGPAAAFLRKIAAGSSRHDAAVEVACWIAREARAGAYPAAAGRAALRDAFVQALAEARGGQRLAGPAEARREFESVWAWAVGQAMALSVDECRARMRSTPAATADVPVVEPLRRPVHDDDVDPDPRLAGSGTSALGTAPAVGPTLHADAYKGVTEHDLREALGDEYYERARDNTIRADVEAVLRRRLVNRLADAEERDPLVVLDALAFLDAPQPEYLVPGLLYRDSTAKVFGPPGGTKSFFLLDLALSLATGTAWHGMTLPRTRVHFVMAEGQAVNVARTLGWLHARGVDRGQLDGWFTAVPQGVLLTPEGIEQYRDLVTEQQPGLIILDTKNAMMLGEENSASDVAVMVRAMRELRDAAGGACVALVDHTGLTDVTRGRGSNAVTAAMDTEVRVERDEAGVATAHVTRDKAAEPGREWSYRLVRVDDVPGLRPGSTAPAVPVPAEAALSVSIHAQDAWWNVPTEQLPEAVRDLGGVSGEAARDIFRALLYGAGDDGLSAPEITKMLKERCPRKYPSDNLHNGRNRLLRAGVIEPGETASGRVLERRFRVAQHVLRALDSDA